jgi:acetyl-CoA acetyltransferase
MEAHYFATRIGFLPQLNAVVKTVDTGGAGPVTSLIEACRMISSNMCDVVAVVAGDAVASLDREEFLRRADQTCKDPHGDLKSPVIPHGYDRVAQHHMQTYGKNRVGVKK